MNRQTSQKRVSVYGESVCINQLIEENWYILYTAPRAEKVVKNELLINGFDVFLPTVRKLSVWKNRQKKLIEHVLFPSYVFVKAPESRLHEISRTRKVVTPIRVSGRACTITESNIEGIRKMLEQDQELYVETNFCEGEQVQVISGPLKGHEGILVVQKSRNRFGIRLTEINQTVLIDISAEHLRR